MENPSTGMASVALCLLMLLCAIATSIGDATADDTPAEPSGVVIATRFGNISIELFLDECPVTAGNFKNLTKQGFYANLTFHRIVNDPGFKIMQGGDPNGDGTGGPGYTIDFEESAGKLNHVRGSVAMARSQDKNSAGSQFFICGDAIPTLDGEYAVFGKVVSGMDVVDAIIKTPTDANDRPTTPVVMNKVTLMDVFPPKADAGKDLEGYVGNSLELQGTKSFDDIGIVVYIWTFVHKGKNVTLEGKEPDFHFEEAGVYNITLTVMDAAGNSASDTVVLTIKEKDLARHLHEWSTIIFLLVALAVLASIAALGKRKKVKAKGG